MSQFNYIRYVIKMTLHCNLFSLRTTVIKDRQNITLIISKNNSSLNKCCFIICYNEKMHFIQWKWWLHRIEESPQFHLALIKVRQFNVLSNILVLIVVELCWNQWNRVVWETLYQKPTNPQDITFFNCYFVAFWPAFGHYQWGSFTHSMLITVFLYIQPKGHREPWNESGSLSLAKSLVGFESETFQFWLQRLNPLGCSLWKLICELPFNKEKQSITPVLGIKLLLLM